MHHSNTLCGVLERSFSASVPTSARILEPQDAENRRFVSISLNRRKSHKRRSLFLHPESPAFKSLTAHQNHQTLVPEPAVAAGRRRSASQVVRISCWSFLMFEKLTPIPIGCALATTPLLLKIPSCRLSSTWISVPVGRDHAVFMKQPTRLTSEVFAFRRLFVLNSRTSASVIS